MNKKYIVRLVAEERRQLKALVKKGKTASYKIRHAHILLAVDADGRNWTDDQAAQAYQCNPKTVRNIRQRLVEQGLEAALEQKPRAHPPRERILDGEKEAKLIAIGCSKPPKGYVRWTVRLLAGKLVEMEIVDAISYETVRRTLKKTNYAPTCANAG